MSQSFIHSLIWKQRMQNWNEKWENDIYLLRTPPNKDAFKHSGGDNLRCTSATVTLYFDVLESKLRRPGTEQNTSLGDPIFIILPLSFLISVGEK